MLGGGTARQFRDEVSGVLRLAAILPDAQLEVITGSRTWVMRDQPQHTAHLIAELARRAAADRHAARAQ